MSWLRMEMASFYVDVARTTRTPHTVYGTGEMRLLLSVDTLFYLTNNDTISILGNKSVGITGSSEYR